MNPKICLRLCSLKEPTPLRSSARSLENRDVTVTESDAAIMMEESAVKAIGDILVTKKRQGDGNDSTAQQQEQTSKRRRHNEACNTTRGATIVGAMRGTCRRDIRETAAYKKKQITSLNAEKKGNEILLTLVAKRKEQCNEAKKHRVQQQSAGPSQTSPSLVGEAIEGAREPREMIVEEYFEVFENSAKDVMDIFLRLFVPESKVLSKNKPIKWCVINEKALPVTKAHFDSKVEAAIQRKIQLEDQLAELENEDTPAGVLQNAEDDTSEGENEIEAT